MCYLNFILKQKKTKHEPYTDLKSSFVSVSQEPL